MNGSFEGFLGGAMTTPLSVRERWNPDEKIVCGNVATAVFYPIWDETNDEMANPSAWTYAQDTQELTFITHKNACQPNLLFVVRRLVECLGYKLINNDFDVEPWNRVVIANARRTRRICETLPHWTVKEFLQQVQYFFNCSILFEESSMSARIIANTRFFELGKIQIGVADDFECEVTKEEDTNTSSLASSSVEFDLSGSDSNLYVSLSDEFFESYQTKEYISKDALLLAFEEMYDEERKKYIFVCPEGYYVYAENEDESWDLKQVNQFGKLRRGVSDDVITCKICPVAISDQQRIEWIRGWANRPGIEASGEFRVQMPTMENPMGDSSLVYDECVWDGINGEALNKKESPEDRLQVMFAGTKRQYAEPDENPYKNKYACPMAFCDSKDKVLYLSNCKYQNTQDSWSFAFAHTGAWRYLGQVHDNKYTINTQTELKFTFIYDGVPDIRSVFIIHNKKYVCKKIEYQIVNGVIGRLKTGYFFEME